MKAAVGNVFFWRSRAALIRRLAAAGLSPEQIRKRCTEEGYAVPTPQAIHRARTYALRGRPAAEIGRPSYYFLWKTFGEALERALQRGLTVSITREMKDISDVAAELVMHDRARGGPPARKRAKPKPKRKIRP